MTKVRFANNTTRNKTPLTKQKMKCKSTSQPKESVETVYFRETSVFLFFVFCFLFNQHGIQNYNAAQNDVRRVFDNGCAEVIMNTTTNTTKNIKILIFLL